MTTKDQLAFRCLLPGFTGTEAPDWVRRYASRGLGGVVLFARNVKDAAQVRALTDALHAERTSMIVAIDEEGGDVTRLEARTGSSYPGNLALGAARDPQLTERVSRAIGSDLARAGIDLDLAPVADVNSDPRNPIIGVRSFGSDPADVERQTASWVKGLQSAGVAACAKHFPGHGDTAVDSHVELPVTASDPREGALAPFEGAIASGVRAVMSAHVLVPALDDVAATISPKVMTALLREELGFTGLAISDGIDMRGISGERDIVEASVLAMRAGCDAICVGGGPTGPEIVDEIVDAFVREVPEERLGEAAARVDELSAWRAAKTSDGRADPGIGLVAARRALCSEGAVRVRDHAAVMHISTEPSMAAGEVPWGVAHALAARGVDVVEHDGDLTGRSLVVVVRDLHRHPDQGRQVEALLGRRPDAVVVEMGVPARRPTGAANYIATYGSARVCAEAAAEVMRP